MKRSRFIKGTLVILMILAVFVTIVMGTTDEWDKMGFRSNGAPQVTISSGAGKASDSYILFHGNAEYFYAGIDDSDDDFVVGNGSVMGTTEVVTISDSGTAVPTITLTGQLTKSQVHTVTDTLTVADCGKDHYLSHATTAIILTLPTPTAGCEMRFITALAFADQHEIRTPAAANIIEGTLQVNAADVACVNEDSLEFADTAETVGDNVSITSDGTSWLIMDMPAMSREHDALLSDSHQKCGRYWKK